MILTFDGVCTVPDLLAELKALGMTPGARLLSYVVTNNQVIITVPDNATSTERQIITMGTTKVVTIQRLHDDCYSYIIQHYAQDRQQSFALLLIEGIIRNYPNRIGYIFQGFGWVKNVIAAFYTIQDQLQACTSLDQIKAITWDFALAFDALDPKITLRQASAINN